MIKLLIAIFLVISSVQASIQSSHSLKQLDKLNIKLKKNEIKIASNIKQVYKLTKKGIINKKLIYKLNRDIKKKLIFKDFRFWTAGLLRTSSAKNTRRLRILCSSFSEKFYTNKLKEELNKNLTDYCYGNYLRKISEGAKNSIAFHKTQVKFIKFHTDQILSWQHSKDLEYLLTRFKPDSKKHKLYSYAILDYYMATNKTPPVELIQNLSLNAKYTRYIQKRDLEKLNTNYVFYKELRKIKQAAFDVVDKETDQNLITKHFNDTFEYFNLTYNDQPQDKAILTLQSISKSYMRRGHLYLARKGFRKILEKKSHHYDDTLFEYIWTYVMEEDFEHVVSIINNYKIDQRFLLDNPKVHFWAARAYKAIGNTKLARTMYSDIIKHNPLSYYAILSSKLLGSETNTEPDDIFRANIDKNTKDFVVNPKTIDYLTIKKVALWGKVHQLKFMKLELGKIKSNQNRDYVEQNLTATAHILSKNDEYLKSFQIIYKSLNDKLISLNKIHLNILFPKPFFKTIKYNSKSFDPIIALSLIRQESGFNATAKSHVGARGLMQLMPRTARQMRRRLKTRHLYNPKTNIKLGTKFFQKLLDHYDENLVYSLAAYNAGKRRVDEWQTSYLNKESILVNIENIPFNETRKYVKLIFRNIFFYKMLNKANLADSKKVNQIFDIKLGFAK